MAKAPLFDHPVIGPPMSALGMVPAYRGSDDAKQVRRNLESLDDGAKVLVDGHAMGIFPEGKSTDHAHLEMIRSGAARMAIQAAEEGAKGVQVVPIGLTYERKEQFRSAVLVRVAKPIDVDQLLQRSADDSRKARREVTEELEKRLKQVVVHLEEPAWEPWLEDLEILVPPPADEADKPSRMMWQRKRIADAMNYFFEHDRPRAETVAAQIEQYREQLRAVGLRIDSAALSRSGLSTFLWIMWSLIGLSIFFLPAMLGTLFHIIPFVLVRQVASRMDQPGRLTISTHRLLVGVPIYLVWYIASAVVLLFYFRQATWGFLIVVAPFAGLVALYYWRLARRTITSLYHGVRLFFAPTKWKQLRQQSRELHDQLSELAREYAHKTPPESSDVATKPG